MLGHLGVNVPDLAKAKEYYDEIMPLLGFEPFLASDDECGYMPADGKRGAFLFLYPAAEDGRCSRLRVGLQHLAFMVPTRSEVAAIHERVVVLGSEVVHAPRTFTEYPQPYYATFWLDPFAFMLEAVCHHDRD